MGRHPNSTSYITPIKSDGTEEVQDATELGRGSFTLEAATTYFFPLGGQDTPIASVHLQHDGAIAITSATVESCNFPESESSNFDDSAGTWFGWAPTTAYVPVDGGSTTATNGVVAVVAGNIGGAMWSIADLGCRRTRLKVVVGATGGEVRVAGWGKE